MSNIQLTDREITPINPNGAIIDVVDAQSGDFRTRKVSEAVNYNAFEWLLTEGANGMKHQMTLKEALVQQPDASNMLRSDFRFLAFSRYAAMPVTYPQFTREQPSSKPEEYYLRDAAVGRLPRVRSGEPAPRLLSSFEGSAVIQNFKYDGIVSILGDDILYDRIGKIRQTAEMLGRSARATEEAECYNVITTAANYTRNSTTGDNDVGANTGNTALTHANFEDAMSIIATAKDRKSGMYMGFMADTIIVGPRLEWQVRKLLTSVTMNYGGDDETERGTLNVYRGAIQRIVVSPYFSNTYEWALCDSRQDGVYFQRVQPFDVMQSTMTADNASWLNLDEINFKVIGRFGVGFVDDRPWYYSTNTSRPTL